MKHIGAYIRCLLFYKEKHQINVFKWFCVYNIADTIIEDYNYKFHD